MSFEKLAPFIQEYIYRHHWTELRPVQQAACQVIFDTDAHLLIAAGTAAGKTEAAFLPVLTQLYQQPSQTIGALYIGPIKALINDQFERLEALLNQADLPVCAWHGDIAQSRKQKLLKQPQGILQITPESLESLLINQASELQRLFGDLRFVVIDEIHAFIGSDRGTQILCQLVRLAKAARVEPRRIGLSATLGDYSLAERWLEAGTSRTVITPQLPAGQRQVQLSLQHFWRSQRLELYTQGNAPPVDPYDRYLFQQSQGKKCLIFANNRAEAEAVIGNLRQIAQSRHLPDIYHVHHGSLSASLRQATEQAMRSDTPAVTAATLTFELGIDIGQLERVIQLEAPLSVASFLQRLGRTGRRGSPAQMQFVCVEPPVSSETLLPEQLPWQLLQAIAVIQLYLEDRWIEPAETPKFPYSLLYHQTLSILAAAGELSPVALAQQVLTLPPFRRITQADFRLLLHHLLELDHLQRSEKGHLLLGLTGERIVRDFKFYAIFADREEYSVWFEGTELGRIVVPPEVGDRLSLAGRTWEVLQVNAHPKMVFVKPSQGKTGIAWRGGGGQIHTRILQRMRQVLEEEQVYPYLQSQARDRLVAARALSRSHQLHQQTVVALEPQLCAVFPWVGTVPFRTLQRFLTHFCKETLKLKSMSSDSPYFLLVNLGKATPENLYYEIQSLRERRLSAEALLDSEEAPCLQKFDDFIPPELRRQAFAYDYLNLEDLKKNCYLEILSS